MSRKDYCPYCMKLNKINFVERNEIIEIKDENISVNYKIRQCTVCNQFFSHSSDADPYDIAYRIYREEHNMTQPEDIKELREKYRLTQGELGKLLGWGAVTLSRYENGALQDDAHQNSLWWLENPQYVLELISKRPKVLKKRKIEYIVKLCRFNYNLIEWDNKDNSQKFDSSRMRCAA